MLKVLKVLNNNGILVFNTQTQTESILLGNGVGFGKRINENLNDVPDGKEYTLVNETERGRSIDIIKNIDPIFLEISSLIIENAEKTFGYFNENTLLTLADHISCAMMRKKNNMEFSNPLLSEIKIIFEKEYAVALNSRDIIQSKCNVQVSEDEVSYIAMHIHSGLTREQVGEVAKTTTVIKNSLDKIQSMLDIEIQENSLSYIRLLMHLKFMIIRVKSGEKMTLDISDYAISNFSNSFKIAEVICEYLSVELKKPFSNLEIGYLAIHIERIRSLENEDVTENREDKNIL